MGRHGHGGQVRRTRLVRNRSDRSVDRSLDTTPGNHTSDFMANGSVLGQFGANRHQLQGGRSSASRQAESPVTINDAEHIPALTSLSGVLDITSKRHVCVTEKAFAIRQCLTADQVDPLCAYSSPAPCRKCKCRSRRFYATSDISKKLAMDMSRST
jgi:hypothetical protein